MARKRMACNDSSLLMGGGMVSKLPNTLSSHNNYLHLSGTAITNIHNNKISISIPKGYANVNVFLTT